MPTASEVVEMIDYVFDELAPKIKPDAREEIAYMIIDEMVSQDWLTIDEEEVESETEE